MIKYVNCSCEVPGILDRSERNSTSVCPCIANIFAAYNQEDATFHNLFLYDALHISDGFSVHHQELKTAHYSVRYLSDHYCYLLLAWPGCIGRLTEIKKLWNVASCWLYAANLNGPWIFSRHFPKIPKYEISWKSIHREPSRSMRTDGPTG